MTPTESGVSDTTSASEAVDLGKVGARSLPQTGVRMSKFSDSKLSSFLAVPTMHTRLEGVSPS